MRRKLLREDAPATGLEPSAVKITHLEPLGTHRQVSVHLETPTDLVARRLWFEPPEAVLSAQIGKEAISVVGLDGRGPMLELLTPEPSGEQILFRIRGQESIKVSVIDLIESLPEIPGLKPRPAHLLPLSLGPVLRSDLSLLRWSFDVPNTGPSSPAKNGPTTELEPNAEPSSDAEPESADTK